VKNQADLPAAQKILAAITVQGLSEYEGKAAPAPKTYNYEDPKLNTSVASSLLPFKDPLQFWSVFVSAMNENPPPKNQIEAVLPNFKYLGIELGKAWDPDKVDPIILSEMKKVGANIGKTISQSVYLVGVNGNGWMAVPANTGAAGPDYLTAATSAVVGLTAM